MNEIELLLVGTSMNVAFKGWLSTQSVRNESMNGLSSIGYGGSLFQVSVRVAVSKTDRLS